MKNIDWKICLKAPPSTVFEFLNTAAGRRKFWAESALEINEVIDFKFITGTEYLAKIIERKPFTTFRLDYFNSLVKFHIQREENGETLLHLKNTNVREEDFLEVHAGWVSVLMALKAAVDYNVDLRNHDPAKTWDQGYADN